MVKIHVLAGNLEHYPLIFNVVIQLSNFKFAAIHSYITQRSWAQKLLWLQWKINNYYNHCKASTKLSTAVTKFESSLYGDYRLALSALLRLLNTLICPKAVEASSFSLWWYRIYIQYCCSGCCSSWKCWLCGTSSK